MQLLLNKRREMIQERKVVERTKEEQSGEQKERERKRKHKERKRKGKTENERVRK